jgi:hypothetical protein
MATPMTRARLREAINTHELIVIVGGPELLPCAWADHYRDCLRWCELNDWSKIDQDSVRAWAP